MASSFYNINGINCGVQIGTIVAIIAGNVPTGWLLCNGSSIATGTEYADLRALIGNTLPNLTDMRMLYGKNTPSVAPTAPEGQNTITLAIANLPAHTHTATINASNHSHGYNDYTAIALGDDDTYGYSNEEFDNANVNVGGTAGSGTTSDSDANAIHAHNIGISNMESNNLNAQSTNTAFSVLNPFYTVKWIIKYA
jgi:microcystin-dependent protein